MYCSRQRQRAARARCWSSRNFLETFVSGRVRARLDPFLLCRNSSLPLPHTHTSQSINRSSSSCLAHSFVVVAHSIRIVSLSYSSSVLAPLSFDTSKTLYLSLEEHLRTSVTVLSPRHSLALQNVFREC